MNVSAIKTHKITTRDTDILRVLDQYIHDLSERSVVAIASKIVSLCEGSVVSKENTTKEELVEKEADMYIPSQENPYGFHITIKNGIMVASAGIDESNGNGSFVLWPKDPQKSVNLIRKHLRDTFELKELGVIITDSKTSPLRWGVTGIAIAYSGIAPLYSYVDRPDVFGRKMRVEKLNILDCLATASVLVTGEGEEQTPIAVIRDIPHASFRDQDPTEEEIEHLKISLDEDIYAPLLKNASWKKNT